MALGTGEELAVYDHSIASGQEAFIYEDDGSLAASAGDANRSLNSASGTETWRMRVSRPRSMAGRTLAASAASSEGVMSL